jgi:DNA-binding CsgD family transcriptional regulator
VLDDVVASVRGGKSRSLLLWGEAGIGKLALLEYLVESVSDLTVVRAVGVESEMELAYASLHLVCGPLLDRLSRLPSPQRRALEVVFGLSDGGPPDRFLVGLAVLTLLSEVAEDGPVLCVVDDAQWLDRASALTLAFVARRLLAEAVGIVLAVRQVGAELSHLPELEVRGLVNGDAHTLLRSAVRSKLDDRVRDRIVAETRGNPLALLELPRGLTATQLAGGFGLSGAPGLSGQIEESFIRRLETLSDPARRLLLLAAAEPVGDPELFWRAAERLGIARAVDFVAETAGLLAIDQWVTFRHPLVRSAVYRSADPAERRAVHLALAESTDREVDPDRRAWHLADAAAGPDESVALELERSASRAQARGGVAAAAAFLKRSVMVSRDPVRRTERALAAGQAHLQAGAFDAALQMLASAEAGSLDELGRAQADLLRGQIEFASSWGGQARALLLRAARRLESLDPALARETYLDAWGAAMIAGRFAGAGNVRDVSRTAMSARQPGGAPRPADLLLSGLCVLGSEGRAAAAPVLRRAVSGFAEGEVAAAEGMRWGHLVGVAALMLWDEESLHKINARQLQTVREAGLLVDLPLYLQGLGLVAAWRGDFGAAAAMIAEGDAVAEATGTRVGRYAAVALAGFRGREAEASAAIEVEVRNASAAQQGFGIQWCRWVCAILYNGLGRYEKALAEAQSASGEAPDLYVSGWALPELIEGAIRTGRTQVAGEGLERLVEATGVGDSDWGLGILARSRALLSDGPDAESSYREAIERLSRTQLRTELARAHLLYGEWLRRAHRRVEAREQLRVAHTMLSEMGMEAFAERARRELHATGAKLRKRTVETRDDLTAHERQIAQLACEGLSNPEIGTRLFLSPRTVEWHLQRIFGKLGIHRRRELASALSRGDSELGPV